MTDEYPELTAFQKGFGDGWNGRPRKLGQSVTYYKAHTKGQSSRRDYESWARRVDREERVSGVTVRGRV